LSIIRLGVILHTFSLVNVILLNVILLSVVLLSVILLTATIMSVILPRVIKLGAIDDSYSAACHSAKCHLIYHSTEFPSATFILLRDIRTNIPPNVILHNVTPLYAVLLNVVAPLK
jgi:hypothetical protein